MTQALKNYAEVYGSFLSSINVGGSKEVALAYAVKDMMNQVKGMNEESAAWLINDEAEYLLSKMQKEAA